jgi:hypothetical protein
MPGDYGAQEPPKPQQSKGCCARICECWLYLLCAAILIVVLFILLAVYGGMFTLF